MLWIVQLISLSSENLMLIQAAYSLWRWDSLRPYFIFAWWKLLKKCNKTQARREFSSLVSKFVSNFATFPSELLAFLFVSVIL